MYLSSKKKILIIFSMDSSLVFVNQFLDMKLEARSWMRLSNYGCSR